MTRYKFGKNWHDFIDRYFTPERLENAQNCLLDTLLLPNLNGKNFLDIGCGSGLHSLAAYRSGARNVISFDYDKESVMATSLLWQKEGRPVNWKVMHGDVLDEAFMRRFNDIDIVYSWGVLHHTGDMYRAIENAMLPLASQSSGVFFIALYSYNAYQTISTPAPEEWLEIKQKYNASGILGKRWMELQYIKNSYFQHKGMKAKIAGLKQLLKDRPTYIKTRGMEWITSIRDWIGGWPMEFVKENELVAFCEQKRQFRLARMLTGEGNTEFLFTKGHTWLDEIFDKRKRIELSCPFVANDPLVWRTDIPEFSALADTPAEPRRSTLLMWENDVPLAYPHCGYANIAQYGAGRYRHWQDSVYFTTSDNTNPNLNGKQYAFTVDSPEIYEQLRGSSSGCPKTIEQAQE